MLQRMLEDPVSKYTSHDIVVVRENVTVSDCVKEMVRKKIDSVLVSENDKVIGIITDKDILSEIVAKGKNPNQVKVIEIAHKPIIEIGKDATVKDAINLMNRHDVRRLVVKNENREIGIISRKQIVGNLSQFSVALPELEIPNRFSCPYCASVFENKSELSHHIDDIHIGRGLLEGNLTKAVSE